MLIVFIFPNWIVSAIRLQRTILTQKVGSFPGRYRVMYGSVDRYGSLVPRILTIFLMLIFGAIFYFAAVDLQEIKLTNSGFDFIYSYNLKEINLPFVQLSSVKMGQVGERGTNPTDMELEITAKNGIMYRQSFDNVPTGTASNIKSILIQQSSAACQRNETAVNSPGNSNEYFYFEYGSPIYVVYFDPSQCH